ncbi:uncharacterized protein LOC144134428 [Amblyomma americanum]
MGDAKRRRTGSKTPQKYYRVSPDVTSWIRGESVGEVPERRRKGKKSPSRRTEVEPADRPVRPVPATVTPVVPEQVWPGEAPGISTPGRRPVFTVTGTVTGSTGALTPGDDIDLFMEDYIPDYDYDPYALPPDAYKQQFGTISEEKLSWVIVLSCVLIFTLFVTIIGLTLYSIEETEFAEGPGGRNRGGDVPKNGGENEDENGARNRRDNGDGQPMVVPEKTTGVSGGSVGPGPVIPTLPSSPPPVVTPGTTAPPPHTDNFTSPTHVITTTGETGGGTFPTTEVIATTTQTTTTTTRPPPLLCSVTFIAALNISFPPDKACDILIYTHVLVEDRKIVGLEGEFSYGIFKDACKLYTDTTCGLSFDIRYVSQDIFTITDVIDELSTAKMASRIYHYAIMNMYNTKEHVTTYSSLVTPIFSEFRKLLGHDRAKNKVIFGVGYFYYNSSTAWTDLAYVAENTATNDVDIVVIITSILTIPSRSQCTTLPANAMRSLNPMTPTMENALLTAMASFGKPGLTVAFSFQMGVLFYKLKERHTAPLSALYKECESMSVSDYSQACQVGTAELYSEKTVIGLNSQESVQSLGGQYLQSHDTLSFMKEKAKIVMNTPGRRPLFTWFLFNVHLTDVTGRCLPGGPFERLKGFRDFYYEEAKSG